MEKYEDLIERYQKDYNERFENNKDKLIEAFVLYYGEEYRDKITNEINSLVISWNVNFDIVDIYENFVSKKILTNRIKYTTEIFNRLGFDISEMQCKVCLGRLYSKSDNLCIDPGMILSARNEKDGRILDDFLFSLYGKRKIFNFDYENDFIYNFYSYTKEEQIRLVKLLFDKDYIDDDSLKKIDAAIEYMDSIKEKKDAEMCYADFLVVYNHLNCRSFPKKIINRLFNIYNPGLVGSYNYVLSQEKYKDFVEFKNKFSFDKSCQNLCDINGDVAIKIITFPIMCTSDEEVIHELNHGITSEIFGVFTDGTILEKYGISVVDDTDDNPNYTRRNLEEYLNQASSIEITDIFHKLGGILFDDDIAKYNLVLLPEYNLFIPLINSFYSTYKDVLKKARITSDLNLLFKYVNKEIFDEYVMFINAIKNCSEAVPCTFEVDCFPSVALRMEIESADQLVEKMRTDEFNEEYLPEGQTAVLTDFNSLIRSTGKTFRKVK